MAIKVIRKGTDNLTNDHNLLLNRGKLDQHPIEAITGLVDALNKKYEKPVSGIPRRDLGFNAAAMEDIVAAEYRINESILITNNSIISLGERTTALEDFINNVFPELNSRITIPNITEFNLESSLFEEYIAVDGDTEFHLSTNFHPGNHSLRVYKNGVLQRCDVDYTETSENTVTFLEPLSDGDFITFYSDTRTNINSPIHEEYEYTGNNVFNLQYRYNLGDNSLSVYHNGVRLNVNRDYTEVDEYTVSIEPSRLTNGDIIVFRRETHLTSNVVNIEDGSEYNQSTWVHETIVNSNNVQAITFPEQYIPGTHTLQVFCDGLLMELGDTNDYVEIDEHTIRFNYPLDIGNVIKVVCAAGMYMWYQTFVSIKDQVIFKLNNSYKVGRGDILVYENGILLNVNDDYIEVNYNTVKFIEPPPFGSYIKIYRRR